MFVRLMSADVLVNSESISGQAAATFCNCTASELRHPCHAYCLYELAELLLHGSLQQHASTACVTRV